MEPGRLYRFGRVVDQNWTTSGGTVKDEYQYGYDRDGNVLYKLNTVSTSNSELYSYDSLNRLVAFERGTLASGDASISGTPAETETWTLDALGNQLAVTTNGTEVDNTFNAQNEMTQNGSATLAYDADGNQTTDELGGTPSYDAWNRLDYYDEEKGTSKIWCLRSAAAPSDWLPDAPRPRHPGEHLVLNFAIILRGCSFFESVRRVQRVGESLEICCICCAVLRDWPDVGVRFPHGIENPSRSAGCLAKSGKEHETEVTLHPSATNFTSSALVR